MNTNKNTLYTILFSLFTVSLASWMVVPYWAVILHNHFNLPVYLVGFILAAANFCQFSFSIFSSKLISKIGTYKGLIASLGVRLIGFALVTNFNAIFAIIGIFLVGIGTAIYMPILKGLLVQTSSPDKLKKNLSIFASLLNLSMFIGPSFGSVFMYFNRIDLLLIFNNSLFVLLLIINILYLKKVTLRNQNNKLASTHKFKLTNEVKLIFLAHILFYIIFTSFQNFTTLYLSSIDSLLYIIAAAIEAILGVLQIVFVRIVSRISLIRIMYISFTFLSIGFCIFGTKHGSLVGYAVVIIIATAMIALAEIFLTMKSDFVISTLHTDTTTSLFGMLRLCIGIGFLFGNLLAGQVYQYFSNTPNIFWQVISVISFFILICLILYIKWSRNKYSQKLQ